MSLTPGYWEPHSSSVEFCEPNYVHTSYVAEIHNAWSSLVIVILPLIGLFVCNLSNEWRNVAMYLVLAFVGCGSVLLHSTLHWVFQSADEVPMLWMVTAYIFSLMNVTSPKDESTFGSALLCVLMLVAQTYIYYTFQHLYWVFLVCYLSGAATVVGWCIFLTYSVKGTAEFAIRHWLLTRGFMSYVLIGGVLWVYEMNACDQLEPHFLAWGGMSFHILWHFGAAYGSYLIILLVETCRAQALGMVVELDRLLPGLPIVRKTGKKKPL
jgi:dihydroceramidase